MTDDQAPMIHPHLLPSLPLAALLLFAYIFHHAFSLSTCYLGQQLPYGVSWLRERGRLLRPARRGNCICTTWRVRGVHIMHDMVVGPSDPTNAMQAMPIRDTSSIVQLILASGRTTRFDQNSFSYRFFAGTTLSSAPVYLDGQTFGKTTSLTAKNYEFYIISF